jgi:hypothetical protein
VVVASEPLDDSPDWRLLRSGELIEVGADLKVTSQILVDGPPPHPLVPGYPTGQDAPVRAAEKRRETSPKPRDLRPH